MWEASAQASEMAFHYPADASVEAKLDALARGVYGAAAVSLSAEAARQVARLEGLGFGGLPVLVAKTHLSTTANPKDRGAPTGWTLPIREVRLAAGAGYVYALAGDMQTMPGLGSSPAATRMDLTPDGRIVGLF